MEPNAPRSSGQSNRPVNPPSDAIENSLAEGLGATLPTISLDMDDSELAANVTKSIDLGLGLHNELKPIQDLNEDYYLGHQVNNEISMSGTRKVRVVENRQFISLETLNPIVTSRPAEPVVFADKEQQEQARQLEKVLVGSYQDQETELEVNIALRHWSMYRLGVLKLVLDVDTGMWETISVRPQRLVFGTSGITSEHVPFIAELVEEPLGDMIKKFPKKEKDIYAFYTAQNNTVEPSLDTPAYYWEFWTNNFCIWKLGSNLILDKGTNPFFDFSNPERNFVKKPFKPYFLINRLFSLGKTVYDDTSIIEQNKSVQDGINKSHWGILADLSDRGTLMGSGDGISREELKKYKGGENEKLWVEKGRPGDALDRLPAKVVNQYALLYQDRLRAISDDLWGTHNVSRGAASDEKTVGGKVILKENDERRTGPISKVLEMTMRRLYVAQTQIIKLFWTEPKDVPYIDPKGAAELVGFSSGLVPSSGHIRVRAGSMLPEDRVQMRNEAIELAKIPGRITNEQLFERLGWAQPQEAAKKVYLAQQVDAGKIPAEAMFPGITVEINEALQRAAQATPGMMPGSMPPGAPPGAIPTDVLGQALAQHAGGTPPPANVIEAARANAGA